MNMELPFTDYLAQIKRSINEVVSTTAWFSTTSLHFEHQSSTNKQDYAQN